MSTFLSIFANISLLVVAYAVPKVFLYCYARKYNTTAKTLLNYCPDLKHSIKSLNALIIICTIDFLVAPLIRLAAGETFNDMLLISAAYHSALIITLGSLFLAYGISYIGDASKKLSKRQIKI